MPDLAAFPPHVPYSSRRPGWLDDRRALIAEHFPSTTADARHWLDDDHAFIGLARDLITIGLADRRRLGPRVTPTPAQARAEWRRLVDAFTADPTD